MSENGGAAKLRALGVEQVDVVPLGVELGEFSPAKRSPALRASLGLGDDEPLLIYAGRLDSEKRADVVVEAFRRLPAEMRRLARADRRRADARSRWPSSWPASAPCCPAIVKDRTELAQWLASADLYVSGMADETFGISVIEAQASGLPVVGVAGGRDDRSRHPCDRPARAGRRCRGDGANIVEVWRGDPPAMGEAHGATPSSSAGSRAWRRCSGRSIRARWNGRRRERRARWREGAGRREEVQSR